MPLNPRVLPSPGPYTFAGRSTTSRAYLLIATPHPRLTELLTKAGYL